MLNELYLSKMKCDQVEEHLQLYCRGVIFDYIGIVNVLADVAECDYKAAAYAMSKVLNRAEKDEDINDFKH